jgi:hypothetical protein
MYHNAPHCHARADTFYTAEVTLQNKFRRSLSINLEEITEAGLLVPVHHRHPGYLGRSLGRETVGRN